MKLLIWIVILFAAAIGLAMTTETYSGNVFVVIGNLSVRMDLRLAVAALVLLMLSLYIVINILGGLFDIPAAMRRMGMERRGKKADNNLTEAGLAYFEGKYQKAEQEAAKVLQNKEAGETRTLALMLAAHSADQMGDIGLRDQYLREIAALSAKNQLPRYLLLAESALNRRDYQTAKQNIFAAAQADAGMPRLIRLQLRYAFDQGDAAEVLDKTARLGKIGAVNKHEAEEYRDWAYRRLLSQAEDADGLKAGLKRIPDEAKAGSLCVPVAERYEQLGLYASVVSWVQKYYPQNHQADLLPPFIRSIGYLGDKEQRKAVEAADAWLKENPEDAVLLMHLGELAYTRQQWDDARRYLEASLAVADSVQARLALAKVFDATGETAKAEAQRLQAVAGGGGEVVKKQPSPEPEAAGAGESVAADVPPEAASAVAEPAAGDVSAAPADTEAAALVLEKDADVSQGQGDDQAGEGDKAKEA